MKKLTLLAGVLMCGSAIAQSWKSDSANVLYGENANSQLTPLQVGVGTDDPGGLIHLTQSDTSGLPAMIIGNGTLETIKRDQAVTFTEQNTGQGDNAVRWLDGSGNLVSSITGSSTLTQGSISFDGLILQSLEDVFISAGGDGSTSNAIAIFEGTDKQMGLGTMNPKAVFHSVGDIRHEDLPWNDGFVVTIDSVGDLYRSGLKTTDITTSAQSLKKNEETIQKLNKQLMILEEKLLKMEKMIIALTEKNQINYEESGIEIFPNPSSNFLSLRALPSNLELQVIINESNGKQLRTFNISGESESTLDISDLQEGNYIITVTSGNRLLHSQVILKK